MDIVRNSAPRAGRIFAALGVLTASVLAAVVPAIVSADTVTERSVELSSSTKDTAAVKYTVNFTTSAAAASTGAFLVQFCDSAAIGALCTTPGGFSTNGVTATSGGTATAIATDTGAKVVLTAPAAASTAVSIELNGIHNPTAAGTLYARIVTYVDDTALGTNTSAAPGTYLDSGAVALTITDGFSVSGSVLESLTFCASTDAIATGCTKSGGGALASPSLKLGTDGVLANTLSEGLINTQISTNAVSGAIVSLKSDAAGCGGLVRQGTGTNAERCGIGPFYNAGVAGTIADNASKFGLRLSDLANTAVKSGAYDTTGYFMDYPGNDTTGVTSTYGSPVYNIPGPASDATAGLNFGANMSSTTPAGTYSAAFSLIATGKF